jgi:nitrate reductase NapE component
MEVKNYERINNLRLYKFVTLILFPLLSAFLFGFLKGFCDYYFDKDFEAKQLLIWVVIYYSVILTLFVSVQADFVKQPDVFINDGTATPFR